MVLRKIVTEGSGGQEAHVGFYWKLTSLLSKTHHYTGTRSSK